MWATTVPPLCFEHIVINEIKFVQSGKYPSPHLDMLFFPLFSEAGTLGERLVLIIFCHELYDVVDVERDVGVAQPLESLQVGGIEFDHCGCVELIIVEWW